MAATTMNPWPISPVTQRDLEFRAVNYDFTSFAGHEEAELPSLEGAIDLSLLDFAASIADQTGLIASLFDGFDEINRIPIEIDISDDIGNTLSDLSNAASAGDAILGDYNGQIGTNSPSPAPTPAPSGGTPPPGGGSATVAADFPGVNCWAAYDVTTVSDFVGKPAYQAAISVDEPAGRTPPIAVVTAAEFSMTDDAQWQAVYVSQGGIVWRFQPTKAGKTRAVVKATCTTDPTTRYICLEDNVYPAG